MKIQALLVALLASLAFSQFIDVQGRDILITPSYNEDGINKQGRYDKILVALPEQLYSQAYIYTSFLRAGRYFAAISPTQPAPLEAYSDQCSYGLTHGIFSPNHPNIDIQNQMKLDWASGTFCQNYLCNNSTGIKGWFFDYLLPLPESSQFKVFPIHLALVNMCMLCNVTRNQTNFETLANNSPGSCNISSSLVNGNFHQSVCMGTNCGSEGPSKNLCVASTMRGICYDWDMRRYYGARDLTNELFRAYIYWAQVVALIIFVPLCVFTFLFVFIPSIIYTIKELIKLKDEMIENRFLTYTRKVLSLYNQSCLYLLIAEGAVVVCAISDFGSFYKLTPIGLIINFFFSIATFISITGMMVHGTDTTRAMQDLPLAPKYVAMIVVSWIILAVYSAIGIILFSISGFATVVVIVLAVWYFGVVVIFTLVGISLFIVLTVLYRLTLINQDESALLKLQQFLNIPYMKTSILLNLAFVLVNCAMILVGVNSIFVSTNAYPQSLGVNFAMPFVYILVFMILNIISNIGLFNSHVFRTLFCKQKSQY